MKANCLRLLLPLICTGLIACGGSGAGPSSSPTPTPAPAPNPSENTGGDAVVELQTGVLMDNAV